jgi:hypothetical protein
MPVPEPVSWPDRIVDTMGRYDETLLRKVAGRLVRPRGQWPVSDLISRCVEMLDNPVALDRRIAELDPSSRQVLAMLGHSRQPTWRLGSVVEFTMALGHADGLAPVLDLLEAGLIYPMLGPSTFDGRGLRMLNFNHWLGLAGTAGLVVFAPPPIASRAVGVEIDLPDLSALTPPLGLPTATLEADGVEYLLRLGVLWQQVGAAPLRRTLQGGLFKRDVDRLGQDPILNAPLPDLLAPLPDLGFLLAELAEYEGILVEAEGELRIGRLPAAWDEGLWSALGSLWSQLFRLQTWSPLDGWRGGEEVPGNPYPSAYLLVFLLLSKVPADRWLAPAALQEWLQGNHPYWTNESVRPSRQKPWLENFLLGVAFPMRLVQARKEGDVHLVRLSPLTRWLLGLGEKPADPVTFPRTLLVQPNLEILAYRQGLTPSLVGRLTKLAAWKTLGAACTLTLEPDTVYRALELGESFESLRQTLEQHGTRSTPVAVLDSLRTWSNKRDRITVFPTAALMEFTRPEDLDDALSRGLPAIRLSATLAVVPSEDQIEFRHFRLAGTRDYALPPERCVTVEADGVTLSVDLARSDLMLETELPRFTEAVDRAAANGKRVVRLTPASLARARETGWTIQHLENWFSQRTGQPIPPAARLLLTGAQLAPPRLLRHLVLHLATAEIADGLMQWPGTRGLVSERLGPTALGIEEENLAALKERLAELGMELGT